MFNNQFKITNYQVIGGNPESKTSTQNLSPVNCLFVIQVKSFQCLKFEA